MLPRRGTSTPERKDGAKAVANSYPLYHLPPSRMNVKR